MSVSFRAQDFQLFGAQLRIKLHRPKRMIEKPRQLGSVGVVDPEEMILAAVMVELAKGRVDSFPLASLDGSHAFDELGRLIIRGVVALSWWVLRVVRSAHSGKVVDSHRAPRFLGCVSLPNALPLSRGRPSAAVRQSAKGS